MILVGEIDRVYTRLINKNSLFGMTQRVSGMCLESSSHITASVETKNVNLFKFSGTVEVLNIWAEATEVVACTNMTACYLDIWDGSNSKVLSKNTADFSGMLEQAYFVKMYSLAEELVFHNPTENRVTEVKADETKEPFLLTAKNGTDNYIRFNFTTNASVDITIKLFIEFRLINGGTIEVI